MAAVRPSNQWSNLDSDATEDGQPLIGRWVSVQKRRISVAGTVPDKKPYPTFLTKNFGKAVPVIADIMSEKLGKPNPTMGFATVPLPEQTAEDGWYLVGDSELGFFDFALLVQEAPGHNGALGLCTFDPKHSFSGEMEPGALVGATVDIYQATPDHDGYVSIGGSLARPTEGSKSAKQWCPPDNFRAIRQDLLAPATLHFTSSPLAGSTPGPVSWMITPNDPEEGLGTGFFWPANSDVERDDMLKREDLPLFVLKRSAIKMQNSLKDLLSGNQLKLLERQGLEVPE